MGFSCSLITRPDNLPLNGPPTFCVSLEKASPSIATLNPLAPLTTVHQWMPRVGYKYSAHFNSSSCIKVHTHKIRNPSSTYLQFLTPTHLVVASPQRVCAGKMLSRCHIPLLTGIDDRGHDVTHQSCKNKSRTIDAMKPT